MRRVFGCTSHDDLHAERTKSVIQAAYAGAADPKSVLETMQSNIEARIVQVRA